MANPKNQKMVETLSGLLAGAKTFFLVDYQGLSSGQLNELRAQLKRVGGRMLVAKNTLLTVALKEQGVVGLDDTLKGPTALVLVGDDPVEPAKTVVDFAKGHAKGRPESKGGMMQGAIVDAAALTKIARLPPREQLLSELVGVLQAPLQQLVGVVEAAPRDLVTVMNNYADKLKEEN